MTGNGEYLLEKVVERVGDLPAMPAIVAEVLHLTDDPYSGMGQMSEAIQRDPALTAKILRVSNSPYYGMRRYVGTLKLALVILGMREIRNIVLGISLFDALRDESTEALLASDFWHHATRVAAFSKKLGSRLELGMQGEDFIAGLIHDIGKLVLWRQLPGTYVALFRASRGNREELRTLEKKHLGFTHADAAAVLGIRWNLPESLTDAVWAHHPGSKPLSKTKDPKLAAIVRIANLAAEQKPSAPADETLLACSDEEAWGVLSSSPKPIGDCERQEVLKGFFAELSETSEPFF